MYSLWLGCESRPLLASSACIFLKSRRALENYRPLRRSISTEKFSERIYLEFHWNIPVFKPSPLYWVHKKHHHKTVLFFHIYIYIYRYLFYNDVPTTEVMFVVNVKSEEMREAVS
jgi:hypothetical protein